MHVKKLAIKILRPKLYSWLRWNYNTLGILSLFENFLKYLILNNNYIKVKILNTDNYINIRPGTTDQNVYDEFFFNNELDYNYNDPKLIVDGGAHIGCASVWFSLKFPNCKIYAIEPDEDNYKLLLSNSLLYPNIIPLKYGLWDKKAFLKVNSSNRENWNYTVSEVDFSEGLNAIGINELITLYNINKIDILKIDIEGSEIELFRNPNWLDKVEFIIIELHDWFRDGCSEAFFNAIGNRKYRKEQIGEKVIVKFTK
jgi:FkbM family methyltransferase